MSTLLLIVVKINIDCRTGGCGQQLDIYNAVYVTNDYGLIVDFIIFPRNASFQEYYVFVSNAAAASQFLCQRDNF